MAAEIVAEVEYRDIAGFEGYRVGSDGTVWTCRKQRSLGRGGGSRAYLSSTWRLKKTYVNRKRLQVVVALGRDGQAFTRIVARLVLEAFVGPCPEGMECLHGPSGRLDNSLHNLKWGTHQGNAHDTLRDGTRLLGQKNPCAKLTDELVREIRRIWAAERTDQTELAKRYGVSREIINHVIRRKTWKHVA